MTNLLLKLYIKKFIYIDLVINLDWYLHMSGLSSAGYFELQRTDEGKKEFRKLIGENLMKKYNVEMVK